LELLGRRVGGEQLVQLHPDRSVALQDVLLDGVVDLLRPKLFLEPRLHAHGPDSLHVRWADAERGPVEQVHRLLLLGRTGV
jgi:hypothetical protein